MRETTRPTNLGSANCVLTFHCRRFITLSLVVMGVILASQAAFAQETISPDDAGAGQLLLKSESGGYRRAPSLESSADFRINGMIARVNTEQSFNNDTDEWREAIYVFPLPEEAAISAMQIHIGERVIEGEIHERADAQAIYQQAKEEGRKSGLVEQERPNLFTTSVANIGPGETVTVALEYVQTVAYDAGEFSLRFPMTLTPRYIPGERLTDENTAAVHAVSGDGWAFTTNQVPDAPRITPYQHPVPAAGHNLVNPITISVDIDAGLPLTDIQSPWHDIHVSRDADHYHLELAEGPVSMSRDFELRWRPETGREPQAALFTETVAGEHFALLMLLPPANTAQQEVLPRDMIFVIDTSGSMGGVSIEQARQGLLLALDRLRPGDLFNVIEFNSAPNALFPDSRPLTAKRLQQAKRFVSGLEARGGTEMYPALSQALTPGEEAGSGHLRQVIFLTDGAVGNETELFGLIREQLGNSRLFTVGIGSAPNSHFMRRAADFGRGTFTHIGSTAEVRQRMEALISKLSSPVVGDLQVEWPDSTATQAYPSRLPDLYQGEPVILAASLSDFEGSVSISGQTADRNWRRALSLEQHRSSPGIASIWARARITDLLDQKLPGRPEVEVREDVLEVALTHKLLSPYTSFVAVEKTPGRPATEALEQSAVPNARPEGQSDQPYAWPATATDSRWQLLLGALLLLLAVLFQCGRQVYGSHRRCATKR